MRREEGLAGLWRGVTPNIGRNAIINAAELASYDSVSLGWLKRADAWICLPAIAKAESDSFQHRKNEYRWPDFAHSVGS